MAPERRDRVPDWKDELRKIALRLPELPLPARQAVVDVVAAFAREDAVDTALHFRTWPGHKARS